MKILHTLFSNGIGGTERHLAELANSQTEHGHEVVVLLRADRHPYEGTDTLLQWLHPQVRVKYAPRRWPLVPLWFMLRQLRPDIIHTHHRRDSRYLAMAAPKEMPVIGTLHMPFRARDYKRHRGIICVAPWQLADVPVSAQRARVVIPNWSAPPPEVTPQERAAMRAQLGIQEGQKLLGAVGRLTQEKGIEDLIDAFIAVQPKGVVLAVFGEGECRPILEQKIAAAGQGAFIHLLGYQADIRRWYAAFDGFVLPSRYETFGLVLLEAMSTGLPILTTRTRGALDVVGQDCSAQWANANDPADLAQSLRQFVARLGQQHYPQLAQYQPQEAFRQVMAFYEAVLAGK